MKHSNATRLCSLLLAVIMIVGLLPTTVVAADATETEAAVIEATRVLASSDGDALGKGDAVGDTGLHVTSVRNYDIAPGISESIVITNNDDGTSQTVANVMEIDVNNGTAKLAAGYGNRDPGTLGWTMATTTDQAHLYEETYDENVVGGVNASLFNIATGQPNGYLVMKGVEYTGGNNLAFVGVFSDNSVGLFPAGTTLEQAVAQQCEKQGQTVTLVDAISGWTVLVDGETVYTEGSNPGYYSRSAIGLKEDGSVVIMEADGTMAPRSLGYTLEEMGNMMKALGCVYAVELDEGGSATYLSQREGEDDLTMRNTPAGGDEREIGTSILVISTAAPSGEFDHADITPDGDYYTPNSEVTLTAAAIDASGAAADAIPETITWALAEGSEDMGTVEAGAIEGDTATAVFKSNGTTGAAVVNMMNGSAIVGTVVVNIQNPDELAFASDEVNLAYEEVSDLGLVAKYQGDVVNLKAGDITWTSDEVVEEGGEAAGSFDGIYFVVTSNKKISSSFVVTATYGELSDAVNVNVGKQPTMVVDGGDEDVWDYSTIGNTVTSFDGMEADDIAVYHYNRGGVVKGTVVTDSDEEYADIVRFGTKAVKIDFDWTQMIGTEGACLGLGQNLAVNGTPTAIGVWVYIPEGIAVPWLRAQIATSSDGASWTNAYIDFTSQIYTNNNLVTGWQYLEADLTAYAGMQIRINSGMLFRAMATMAGIGWYTVDGVKLDQSQLTGYLIIDNLQFVYGANNQDVTLPSINDMQFINDDGTKSTLENGGTYDRNNFNFFVTYDDNEDTDEFATGIESAYFYLDGVYYGEGTADNLGSTLAGIELANGEHSLTFYLKDGFGNVTRQTRYFTVAGTAENTGVSMQVSADPMVGKDWTIDLKTNNISDMATMNATLSISRGYAVTDVVFSRGVTGTYTFNESKGTVDVEITSVADTASGSTLATVYVNIPAATKQGASVSVAVTQGTYTTDTGDYYKGFSTAAQSYAVGASYVVSAPVLVAGLPAEITVNKASGSAASGVTVYYGDGTVIGTTNSVGKVNASVLTEAAATYTVYAMDVSGNLSYPVEVTSYTAVGGEVEITDEETGETTVTGTGAPYYILNQVAEDPATMQNITWMSNPLYASEAAQAMISTSEDMAEAVTVTGTSNVVFYSGSGLSNRANAVVFTGLTPATTYYYQVGDGTTWSQVKSFTTNVAEDEETNIFMMADIQEEDALTGMARIAGALADSDVEFDLGIQTGDAVDNVRYYNQWEDALDLFSLEGIADYDMIHVEGNHEGDDGGLNGYATKSIFNLDGDWYSVEYGDVYIAVLNYSTEIEEIAAFGEWLKEDAAASDCGWKIVAAHIPVYTTNPGGQDENYLNMMPGILQEAGIDFYFSGDAHSYARTKPVVDGAVSEDGVVYYICGSTGGKSYSVVNNPEYNFEIATLDFESVYMTISADQDKITVNAYNVETDGSVELLDSYSKEKDRCENDEHTYTYTIDTDTLVCDDCGYKCKAAKEQYAGWATESVNGGAMYFVGGKPAAGDVKMEDNSVCYFDENGIALQGEVEILGETCVFEKGIYVSSVNENVKIAGYTGTNIQWILYNDGTFKIDGTGDMRNYSIRGGAPWAEYKTAIKSIEIGAEITSIGVYAFHGATKCESVTFAEGSKLTAINGSSFYYMQSVSEIILPEGVTTIGNYAFGYCFKLTHVYLPEGIDYINPNAFNYCDKLTTDQNLLCLNVAKDSYAHEYAVAQSLKYELRDENGETIHTWDEGIVETEVSCTEAGVKIFTCTTCGTTKTETIEALGHAWDEGVVETAATCTEAGVKAFACATCGETRTEAIEALGHAWDDGVVTTEPTYTKAGEKTYTCATCGETRVEAIPALGSEEIENPFTDVKEADYFYDPVMWAVENEITKGMTDTTFVPKGTITREQFVTFLWRMAGEPEPETTENPFTDVKNDQWHAYSYKAILWAYENEITTGATATTFNPNDVCTRAQVVAFLWRYAGQPEVTGVANNFTDVEETQWSEYYYDAVLWAVQNGITTGVTDTTFCPKDTCTRAQCVTFLYRYAADNT